MSEERICGTCACNVRDWTNKDNTDFYCKNPDSYCYGCNTAYTDGCEDWEEKE